MNPHGLCTWSYPISWLRILSYNLLRGCNLQASTRLLFHSLLRCTIVRFGIVLASVAADTNTQPKRGRRMAIPGLALWRWRQPVPRQSRRSTWSSVSAVEEGAPEASWAAVSVKRRLGEQDE